MIDKTHFVSSEINFEELKNLKVKIFFIVS
jgi:hypothetical protein